MCHLVRWNLIVSILLVSGSNWRDLTEWRHHCTYMACICFACSHLSFMVTRICIISWYWRILNQCGSFAPSDPLLADISLLGQQMLIQGCMASKSHDFHSRFSFVHINIDCVVRSLLDNPLIDSFMGRSTLNCIDLHSIIMPCNYVSRALCCAIVVPDSVLHSKWDLTSDSS